MKRLRLFSPHRLLRIGLLVASGFLTDVGPAGAQPARAQPQEETRMLWTRSDERYIRSWLVLEVPVGGGDAFARDWLAASGGEAAVRPNEVTAQPLHDGTTRRWRRVTSWADAIDLTDGARMKRDLVGYAFTTIARHEAGQARLYVGSDEGIAVWVNGARVLERRGPRPLNFDEDQVEIMLNAGDNTLLVKVEQRTGPWTFAARVLESGAIARSAKEIAPALFEAGGSQLIVKTDVRERTVAGAEVVVEAIGAGGTVHAAATVTRDGEVRLDPASWPDGAYEIRCETRTLEGARVATHLPWYRGDAVVAARRMVAAGAEADRTTATGATMAMLADMVIDRLGGSLEGHADNPWWAVHSPLMEFAELNSRRAVNSQHVSGRMDSCAWLVRYSLVLIGGAEANQLSHELVARGVAGPLPLQFDRSGIRVGDRLVSGTNLRVQAITVSPFNPERYVAMVAGTSAAGLARWTPDELRYAEFDFTIAGAEMAERTSAYQLLPVGPVRGWFDHAWQVDPALIVP